MSTVIISIIKVTMLLNTIYLFSILSWVTFSFIVDISPHPYFILNNLIIFDSSGHKWADAADRMMNNRVFSLSLPREHRKKEPLGQANSNSVSNTVNDFDR